MRKRVFVYCICLVTALVGLVGCSNKPTNISTPDVSSSTTDTTISTDAGDKTTVGDLGTTTIINENTANTITNAPVPAKTTTAHSASVTTKKPVAKTTKKPVAKTTNKPTPTTTQKPTSQWDLPAQGNEELLKQRIVFYINKYRATEGKATAKSGNTPKMQKYADIRVQDLLTDFSHNNDKTQAARNKAQLGKPVTIDESYFDPTTNQVVYTGKKVTHYNGTCAEAIGQANNGSIDYTAKSAADGVYASKGHWAYIGGATATNLCVGIKYGHSNEAHGNAWFIVLAVCSDADANNNEA